MRRRRRTMTWRLRWLGGACGLAFLERVRTPGALEGRGGWRRRGVEDGGEEGEATPAAGPGQDRTGEAECRSRPPGRGQWFGCPAESRFGRRLHESLHVFSPCRRLTSRPCMCLAGPLPAWFQVPLCTSSGSCHVGPAGSTEASGRDAERGPSCSNNPSAENPFRCFFWQL